MLRIATTWCQTATPVMGKLNSPPVECSSRLLDAATFHPASVMLGLPRCSVTAAAAVPARPTATHVRPGAARGRTPASPVDEDLVKGAKRARRDHADRASRLRFRGIAAGCPGTA